MIWIPPQASGEKQRARRWTKVGFAKANKSADPKGQKNEEKNAVAHNPAM
jgi:hypothetical protein